jgi:hypothetical protein
MAQSVCVVVNTIEREQLAAIVADPNRPCKHAEQARIVLEGAAIGLCMQRHHHSELIDS